MKKTKRLLSALTALTITASAFAGLVIPASAADTVYVDENFDSYTTGNIIASVAGDTAPTSVTNGKLVFEAGNRASGIASGGLGAPTADITADGVTGNALTVKTNKWANDTRGIRFSFASTAGVPAFASIGDGNVLVMEFDVKTKNGEDETFQIGATGLKIGASTAGITPEDWSHVEIIFNNATQKETVIVTDSNGLTGSTTTALAGTEIGTVYFNKAVDTSTVLMDNLKVFETEANNYPTLTMKVVDGDEAALSDANVVIGAAKYTTPDSGTVDIVVPAGEHDYTVSKDGYEATAGGDDNKTGTINITETKTETVKMLKKSYTPIATTVSVGGGQEFISASVDNTPATTEAFTVAVKDQNNIDMESSGYTTAWAVYPTGTTEADDNVTIDSNGIVSVTKDYQAASGDVAVFDVVATVTDSNDDTKTATNKATITIANSDILLYDVETSFTATGGTSIDYDIDDITIPANGLRIAFNYYKGTYDASSSTSYGQLSFKSGNDTIFYMKDMNAGLTLYTDDNHSVSLGTTVRGEKYPAEITIIGSQLIAKFNNGEYKVVEFAEAPTTITSINASTSQNGGSGSGATDLIMSSKITVDKNKVEIVGDDEFATITGKTVTRQYSAKSYVPEASDSFTWEVTQAEGVSIDAQSGLLSVTDDATPGTVTVTATSGTKTGSMDVTITAVSTYTATVEYPKAVQKGESAKLTVTRITDALGDDVTEYFSPVWSIDNAPDVDKTLDYTGLTPGEATAVYAIYDGAVLASVESEIVTVAEDGKLSVTAPSDAKVYIWDSLNGMKPVSAEVKSAPVTTLESTQLAAIGSRSGNLITNSGAESGTVTVKLNITGSDAAPTAYDIAVDNYSKIVDYTVELTSVSVADLVDDSTITGYQVTVADADGNQLAQEVVQASGSEVAVPTVSDGTPAKVEVAPVFTATDSISSTSDERYAFNVPAAAYDITVTMSGSRADLYVNNQLVVNNMLQYASQPPYTDVMHDVVVSEGYAKMITTDYSSGKGAADSPISKLQIVKSPSIVTRKTKIYVMGDSLVAKYYEDADKMTGWGQVLQNYITDDIEVVDIANSGACTVDIAGTQLTRIIGSAQPGDYVVLESGYNDKGHKDTHGMTVEIMKERVSYMVNAMKAKGVKVILVTPNASAHDYNNSVAWASGILDSANELNVDYINLSKLSYDFLYGKYGADFTANETLTHTYNIYRTNENGLHSTVNAANCWAAIIAAELEKLDIGVETTNYEYQFNDGTNDITVSVANMSN